MNNQRRMKLLFKGKKFTACFNCPDRRANCHAHCEKYQKEVAENNAEKEIAMKQYSLAWDLENLRRDNIQKWYKRCKRR